MLEDLKFFDPFKSCEAWKNRLPHWQQPGATYFVTFRLSDALPAQLIERWLQERDIWLSHHPEPWTPATEREYHTRFSATQERWLDEGHGSCLMKHPEAADVVAKALTFYHEQRYVHHAWVIMPNHVHALFSLHASESLASVVQAWKSVSSRRLARLPISRPLVPTIWQKDYFDRLIRDEEHFWNVVNYIQRNPAKARLHANEYRLWSNPKLLARSPAQGGATYAPCVFPGSLPSPPSP